MTDGNRSTVLRFLTCGSVDDGKSTLIGHLLYKTGNVFTDQQATLQQESARIGNAGEHIDYSLLLDGLLSEREQGITIDVAYRYFFVNDRKYIVADTPGHQQYTRNTVTGASHCDAALILIDARAGILEQTRRHTLVCALMGIRSIAFICNKMDLTGWDHMRYETVVAQCNALFDDVAGHIQQRPDFAVIPVSSLFGDNLIDRSGVSPWYDGPTVMEWLQSVEPASGYHKKPFRFSVEYVIKPGVDTDNWQQSAEQHFTDHENYRAYAGRVHSGTITTGDSVVLSASGTSTVITGILNAGEPAEAATAGESVSFTINKTMDISRGDGLSSSAHPPVVSNQFKTYIVWMHEEPLFAGRTFLFKSVYGIAPAEITHFSGKLDVQTFQIQPCENLSMNDIGLAEIAVSRPVPFDPYHENKITGGFILIDRKTNATAGCGMILHDLRRAHNIAWQDFVITPQDRARLLGQKPLLLWFTGLSGSGKSTIANIVAAKLHKREKLTYIIDGDNLRHGINKDLGFTPADRVENIRRAGHIAHLMMEAGVIVLTAFISPFRADRALVRALCNDNEFIEIYVSTPLDECERRDTKGLYKKARNGELPNLTGIGSPYEDPVDPELVLDTMTASAEELADTIITYLEKNRLLRF